MLKIILFLILMSSVTLAQTLEDSPCDPKPEAIIFYELGTATKSKLQSRTEKYLEKLTTEPNSQGVIINYGSNREVARREKIIRELIVFRTHNLSRIIFVSGGNETTPKTELWIVPPGADYPIPNYAGMLNAGSVENTVRIVKTIKTDSLGCQVTEKIIKTGKFDVFGQVSERYFNWILGDFVENLEFDKTVKGYVLIYGNDKEINNTETRIRNLESVKKIAAEQLIFIRAGSKKELMTELWIVPEGTEPPKP